MKNLHSLVYSAFDNDPSPITAFMQWLAASHHLPDRLHLLDVGCGPGRMLKEYAKLGWQVTGMETEEDFLKEAHATAQTLPHTTVLAGGFNEIQGEACYDIIAAVNSPFAYLLTHAEQCDALARSYRALRPGGLLFLDVPNLLWFLKHERAPITRTAEVDGYKIRFLELHDYDFHDAHFIQTNEYKVTRASEEKSFTLREKHVHRITPPPDLIRMVAESGFEAIQTFNSYESRSDERLNSRSLLLSARKPGQIS